VRIQCRAEALPAQKKWNGCWGIVQSIGTPVQVLINDQKVDYEEADLKRDENSEVQFHQTCERILALWQTELEAIEQTLLQELLHRQSFTDLETQMICWLETKRSGMMF